jgi:hypothetical protein
MAGEFSDRRRDKIKTVPYVRLSHLFLERLIGTIPARILGPDAIQDRRT